MARETDADVHKPRWVQGCADSKHLGPRTLDMFSCLQKVLDSQYLFLFAHFLGEATYSQWLQCKANAQPEQRQFNGNVICSMINWLIG